MNVETVLKQMCQCENTKPAEGARHREVSNKLEQSVLSRLTD